MPHIINPYQAEFKKGEQSTDNIILANEILNEFKLSSIGEIFYAKFDIKKALIQSTENSSFKCF